MTIGTAPARLRPVRRRAWLALRTLTFVGGLGCHTPTDSAATPIVPTDTIIPSVPCAATLGKFGGLNWNVRAEGLSGPGPNVWNACNAWLDSAGLHLKMQKRDSVWTSAEVYTSETVGYGRFEFEIATRLDALDPNVVLGLFTYPGGALDGRHEIDIEVARFGATAPAASNLNYAVYPGTVITTTQGHCALRWDSPVAGSVHRFLWSAGSVRFQSFATTAVAATTPPYRSWTFTPTGSFTISSGSWPLRLNLWLFNGKAPANALPLEVVIRRVTYSSTMPTTPAPSTTCG